MPDYKNMTAIEALRHAREVSGLTPEEIAARTGQTAHVIRRYFRQQEGYMPSLDRIAPLCRALGNRFLMDWLLAQLEDEPPIAPAKTRTEVFAAVARASATLGDCQRALADSGSISPELAREIRSILKEAAQECEHARAMLASMAEKREPVEPLASLGTGIAAERKWWEIWK